MLRDWLGDWVGTFQGHKGAVWSGRLSGGEASRAVTGSADFSAKVWDTFSGDCLHTFAHNHIVRAVAIDAGGSRILTGGHEKKLRLFDLAKPDADAVEFGSPSSPAHDGNIKSILWSRTDENVVLTAAEDKKVKWWDVRSGKTAHEMQFDAPIASMEKSPSTGMPNLVTLASGNRAIFLDAANRTIAKEFTLPHPPSSVSLHPTTSSRFIAGALNDGWIRIHDYNTGEQLELHKGHHGPAHVVAYSPDGELAASGSEDGELRRRRRQRRRRGR